MPQPQSHLQGPDYAMLVGYFVLMVAIGLYFYRHMHGIKAYFSGNNTIPWWLSGVSFYMTSFSALAFVTYPSLCYRYGWVGITALWVAVPATLFSTLLFAKRWRRARIDSPVEYIETRYSALLRQLFTWHGLPVKVIDDGLKLVATGKFVSICSGLSLSYSILVSGGIMLLYTFLGGLWAVAVTDFVQFVVLTAGILVVLPLSISKAGGLTALIHNSPEGFFRLTAPKYNWGYMIPLILMYALAWSSINWALIQRYYCVPKEKDALKVGWLVVALYIIGPPLMFFPAIAAARFIPHLKDAGDVYPVLCAQLLPAGMLGLAVAAMFAATMSTLSGDYNVCAGVLTNDVYRRLMRPHATPRELVFVGRAMTLLIGVIGLGVASLVAKLAKAEDLFNIMVTLFSIATAPVAIPMIFGLVSKKITNLGALAGFICGTANGLGLFLFLRRYGAALASYGIVWNPDVLVIHGYLCRTETILFLSTALTTLVVMLLVSALKPMSAQDRPRIDAFRKRLETPIGNLEEDRDVTELVQRHSPFRLVGICTLIIGLMMFAMLPWARDSLTFRLDFILSAVLAVLGAIVTFWPKKP